MGGIYGEKILGDGAGRGLGLFDLDCVLNIGWELEEGVYWDSETAISKRGLSPIRCA